MVPASGPDPDLPVHGADGAAGPAKARGQPGKAPLSTRSFLLAGTGVAGLVLVMGTGLWLARIPLAESAIAAVLHARGVDGAVELQRLDFGGFEAASLRLGPARSATVETGRLRASYHYDWSTGRLSLDRIRAEGVTVRLATDGTALDLGALAPLLAGPAGPRRVDIVDADLGLVRLEVATPVGTSLSRLAVRGSDQAGWTISGQAGVPAGLRPERTGPRTAMAVPVGLAVRMPPDGAVVAGFSLRPAGLDIRHASLAALGVEGRLNGWVRMVPAGGIEAAITGLDMVASQLALPGLMVTQAALVSTGLTWRHGSVWNQDAVIAGRLQVRAGRATLRDLATERFDAALDIARAADGAATLAVTGNAARLVVPGQAIERVQVNGRFGARAADLLLPGGWSVTGESEVRADSLAVPLPALAGPDPTRLPTAWRAQGRFALSADATALAVRPLGALELGGARGDRIVLNPSAAPGEGLRLALDRPGAGPVVSLTANVAGTVDGAQVAGGRIGVRLAENSGWALDLAGVAITGLRVAGYRLDASDLSGSFSARPAAAVTGRMAAQVRASSLRGAPVELAGLDGRIDAAIAGTSASAAFEGSAQRADVGGYAADSLRLRGDLELDWRSGTLAGRTNATGTARRIAGQGVVMDTVVFTTTGPAALRLGESERGIAGSYRLSAQRIASRDVRLENAVSVGQVRLDGRDAGLSGVIDQRATANRLASPGLQAETVSAQTSGTVTVLTDRTIFSTDFSASLGGVETGGSRFANARVGGPVTVTASGGRTRVATSGCLDLATGSLSSPTLRADGLIARLCPDEAGRLADFGPGGLQLAGTVTVQPVDLTLAAGAVRFGAVEGTFRSHPGGWAWDGTAPGLGLDIPLDSADPAAIARIRAERASVTLVSADGRVTLAAGLDGISAEGLPVAVAGSAQANLALGSTGIEGTFAFTDLAVEDAADADLFGAMLLTGTGTLSPTAIRLDATARESRTGAHVARFDLSHEITTGAGRVVADIEGLAFNPRWRGRPARQGLQPADLVPPLRGLVGEAQGALIGSATVAWTPDSPVSTEGLFAGTNLSFATLAGPFDQVSATVSLVDLLNPTTNGVQRLTIGAFNPGIPLESGVVLFELRGDRTVQVISARWPFAGGTLELDPASIAFEGGDQSFVLRAQGIELSQFLELTQVPNLTADGTASGVLPVVVRGGVAEIVGGRLSVDTDGGTIRYTGPDASGSTPSTTTTFDEPVGFFERMRRRVEGEPAPQGADLAVAALRNFQFKVLELSVDGRVTGDLDVGVVLEGANPDVLAGTPFRFNIRATGPMMRLLQNIGRLTDPQGYVDIVTAPGADAPSPLPPSQGPQISEPAVPAVGPAPQEPVASAPDPRTPDPQTPKPPS